MLAAPATGGVAIAALKITEARMIPAENRNGLLIVPPVGVQQRRGRRSPLHIYQFECGSNVSCSDGGQFGCPSRERAMSGTPWAHRVRHGRWHPTLPDREETRPSGLTRGSHDRESVDEPLRPGPTFVSQHISSGMRRLRLAAPGTRGAVETRGCRIASEVIGGRQTSGATASALDKPTAHQHLA